MPKSTTPSAPIFYVYVLTNPLKPGYYRYGKWIFHHEPFYVGKGKGSRYANHSRPSCVSTYRLTLDEKALLKREKKLALIRSIFNKTGEDPITVIKKSNLDEPEAFRLERLLVEKLGRSDLGLGPLLNKTNGGNGGYSGLVSDETRALISANSRRMHLNRSAKRKLEIGRKQSAGIKDFWNNASKEMLLARSTKAKQCVAVMSPEARAARSKKISEHRRRYYDSMTQEIRVANSAALSKAAKLDWARRKSA